MRNQGKEMLQCSFFSVQPHGLERTFTCKDPPSCAGFPVGKETILQSRD